MENIKIYNLHENKQKIRNLECDIYDEIYFNNKMSKKEKDSMFNKLNSLLNMILTTDCE